MFNLKLGLKKEGVRRISRRRENQEVTLDVRKVLTAADQKLILMVRS